MSVNESLAQASNTLVYSSMAVYTGALLAFTVDLSGRGRPGGSSLSQEQAEPQRERVAAGAASASSGSAPRGGISRIAAAEAPGAPGVASPLPAGHSRAAGIAVSLTWLAFLLHLGGVVARAASAQRVPWGNMYEFSVSGSLVVTGVFLALLTRRDLRYLGTFVTGPVLLTLGLAVTVLYTRSAQLMPALRSYWLVIHVSVAFIASALLTLGFCTTVLQEVQARREAARAQGRPPARGAFMDRLPGSEELERSGYRMHMVAFPLWTFSVIAGAIWAEAAWGRYWGWDPKEVWSFVIWMVYAAYLHARLTRGWDGSRAAAIVYVGYGCLLFNFLVVNIFFVGKHSYSGL
ncbi:MAG: c-type cytochrome biogenesis protein CcsB [Kineosporiaceae bacterium]